MAPLLALLLCVLVASCSATTTTTHSNNWAVLVSTSRFWFNYRHMANVLSVYRTCKRLGIPDSHIILMLSDDVACNTRNILPARVYNNERQGVNMYGTDVEVDYRGYEVTVEAFIRLLTGRHAPATPRNRRLLSDARSNVLIYMTGHGGDDFLKFQDAEEISGQDIADAIEQMRVQRRFNELLFIVDTCQANTLFERFYSPRVLAAGSSRRGENSYSHHSDRALGVTVIDRFTYYLLEFMEAHVRMANASASLDDLRRALNPRAIGSHPGWRTDLFAHRALNATRVVDFFGQAKQLIV